MAWSERERHAFIAGQIQGEIRKIRTAGLVIRNRHVEAETSVVQNAQFGRRHANDDVVRVWSRFVGAAIERDLSAHLPRVVVAEVRRTDVEQTQEQDQIAGERFCRLLGLGQRMYRLLLSARV